MTSTENHPDFNLFYSATEPSASWGKNHALEMPGATGSLIGWGTGPCTGSQYECGSKWGSPRFTDSTFATFDGRLASTSWGYDNTTSKAAWGSYWSTGAGAASGGYVGAINPGDVTAPDSMHFTIQAHDCGDITTGSSHPGCVYIAFTFTGDDGSVGSLDSVQIAANLNIPAAEVQPNASNWNNYRAIGPMGPSDIGGITAFYNVPVQIPGNSSDQVIRLNYGLLSCNVDGYVFNVTLKAKDKAGNATYSYQRATGANCPW